MKATYIFLWTTQLLACKCIHVNVLFALSVWMARPICLFGFARHAELLAAREKEREESKEELELPVSLTY